MKNPRLGARRALQLFLAALALQVILFLIGLRHISSTNDWAQILAGIEWLFGGLLTLVLNLIAATVIHFKLAREERNSFWARTVIYLLALALIWYATGRALLTLVH